ncbi:DNA-binding transcriptional regulator, AcrR family [Nakamurella panacisegetis]|uniref:DNA-binding transcriptional regulator, AcrR family n=1 Tax=Nakamurella panacisegetis TaxID=1090615 RepID=A0A1H0LJ86_9ACTN|nr:TetR/AcrR family transcriptional regulator [Nakamurella panacisegetis]SDO68086.1 DNA-binding transcriptional regulator, AcrR family [Nakamurella panacisegetis]
MVEVQRADAQRNRARILEVAYPAFAADPEVSLNAIAKLAGVGPGTLYRHFPTREALVLAVYQEEVANLVASVDGLLLERDPLDAFRAWARGLAAHARMKHGLGEALTSDAAQAVIGATWGPVSGAIATLLNAAVARGDIRVGIDPNDVILLLSCLWRVPPGEAGLVQADRLLEMIIAALRS